MVSTKTTKEVKYFYATGKRKSAIAKVRIYPSKEKNISISINERTVDDFFPLKEWQQRMLIPFNVVKLQNKFDLVITGMSSIALESIAIGVPVIVINKEYWFFNKSIPDEISKKDRADENNGIKNEAGFPDAGKFRSGQFALAVKNGHHSVV